MFNLKKIYRVTFKLYKNNKIKINRFNLLNQIFSVTNFYKFIAINILIKIIYSIMKNYYNRILTSTNKNSNKNHKILILVHF